MATSSETNWTSALADGFREAGSLSAFLGWPLPEGVAARYPVLVPRRLAEMIREQGPRGPLALQFLPHADETAVRGGFTDPIGDQVYAQGSQLVHRYQDRALLLPTTKCPVNCRYCFRKNELGADGPFGPDKDATLAHLRANRNIEEVILTGGDPLVLSDERIASWLEALAQIPHVRWVRFHTRAPVVLPERLTPGLADVLRRFAPRFGRLRLVVHTNHASEWDANGRAALRAFQDPAWEWLSQSVLLRGVNDSTEALEELLRQLVEDDVRPYYLHHPDQAAGAMHFYISLMEGRRIFGALRERLPGWALPEYVVDVPGGHGKVPAFNPEGHAYRGKLLNRQGNLVDAPEQPAHP